VTARTIERIWKQAKQNHIDNGIYSATPQKEGKCGVKPIYPSPAIAEAVKTMPMNKRGTMRALANQLGVSTWVVQDKKKKGVLFPHTNSIKPHLTEHNLFTRYSYALNRVRPASNGRLYFTGAYDEVHVDEKWFNITQINKRFYLAAGEDKPHRTTRHKNFIIKVMFLAAIARPRFNRRTGACTFDGKIGIWPFVHRVRAQRSSTNRPAGTIETKTLNVDKKVYKEYMIEKVIPAIREKWPQQNGNNGNNNQIITVGLQDDNATPHSLKNDLEWECLLVDPNERIQIEKREQPANSPDTNCDDLGFFRALQLDTWAQTLATTIDGLCENVAKAFSDYDTKQLNRIWLTHASVCDRIICCNGNNNFDIPHMSKAKLERAGALPSLLPLSSTAIEHYNAFAN